MFSLIAAIGQQGQLGLSDTLPWPELGQDRRWFRAITTAVNPYAMAMHYCQQLTDVCPHCDRRSPESLWRTDGNAVIMGRRTWESLGRQPLPQRYNIVLSSQQPIGVHLSPVSNVWGFSAFVNALYYATTALQAVNTFFIGGAQLFAEALTHPGCERLYLTEVDYTGEADTVWPGLLDWKDGTYTYAGQTWERTHQSLWCWHPQTPFRFSVWDYRSRVK